MEGLLCSQEMAEIEELFKNAYNLESNLILFPVRHHSPACAFHLKKTIDDYNPDIILIEGPSNTNSVLKFIEHEESEAPLCMYYSYSDKKGVVGEKDGKYMCYYPFLDYSPELVAIREAKQRGITAEFIDLQYPEILINSSKAKGFHGDAPKASYNDDYLMQRGEYLKRLCEKEGCRNFSELWEKFFELDGINLDTASFVKNMLAFCYLSRVGYTKEMLESDGCSAREAFMAKNIKKTLEKYERVLVVTGGFHTYGIIGLIQNGTDIEIKNIDLTDSGAYAMAYSMEESDQLNGYASGMPHPAFYQEVWENISSYEPQPYEKAVLKFIIKCGAYLRKKEGGISTADEIEAYNMANGLKFLREKSGSGVYELIDAIRSCFVKGELNYFDKSALEALYKMLTGKKVGKLCVNADVPPLVKDFREKSRYFKLKVDTTAEQEITLNIYNSTRHRECSKLLNIMLFLATSFCKKIKGPDFSKRTNTNIVREMWKYRWNTSVDSSLIELSVYGGSLVEVAGEIARKRLADIGDHAGAASLLMIDIFMMGLEDNLQEISEALSDKIDRDGIFFSVVDCIYNLNFLNRAGSLLYGSTDNTVLDKLIFQAYNKAVILIASLANTPKDSENKVISKLKDIYHISRQEDIFIDSGIFEEALMNITDSKLCNSAVEGAALGLLFGMGRIKKEQIIIRAEGYLYGTGEKFLESANFLKGIFSTAREVIFYDKDFIDGINNVLHSLPEEEFIKILPEFRLSFSFFNPQEIEQIGKKVAEVYNTNAEDILRTEAVDSQEVDFCRQLDSLGTDTLKLWGIKV